MKDAFGVEQPELVSKWTEIGGGKMSGGYYGDWDGDPSRPVMRYRDHKSGNDHYVLVSDVDTKEFDPKRVKPLSPRKHQNARNFAKQGPGKSFTVGHSFSYGGASSKPISSQQLGQLTTQLQGRKVYSRGKVAKLYAEARPSTAAEIAAAGWKDPRKPKRVTGRDVGLGAGAGFLVGMPVAGPLGALGGAALGAGVAAGADALTYNKRGKRYKKIMSRPIRTVQDDNMNPQAPWVGRHEINPRAYKEVTRFSRATGGEKIARRNLESVSAKAGRVT